MAENRNSTDGIAEDLIRAFIQIGCAENHAKTLLEKAEAELNNGLVDMTSAKAIKQHTDHMNELLEEIDTLAELRRDMMRKLQSMYPEGDKTYWCMVKHLGIGAYTAFEVYQASDDDSELLNMALEANRRFINALSHFVGTEITECAACFADMIKKGEDEDD